MKRSKEFPDDYPKLKLDPSLFYNKIKPKALQNNLCLGKPKQN